MAAEQINIEYFFRLFYDLLFGTRVPGLDYSTFIALAGHIWFWISVLSYIVSIIALFVIVYATMRLYDIRKREEAYFSTLIVAPETVGGVNPRWKHIEELAGGTSPSQWKEAILEADIMLDDALAQAGYTGDTLADKLKSVPPKQLASLQDAWEAHKVRNQIAHQGALYDLSETTAHRTIVRFENVLRELKAI